MGLGRLMMLFGALLAIIFIASNIGYKVGHFSGVSQAKADYQKAQLEQQTAATGASSAAYANVSDNPLENVSTNPFDNYQ